MGCLWVEGRIALTANEGPLQIAFYNHPRAQPGHPQSRDDVCRALSKAQKIYIAVAFVKTHALKKLLPTLRTALSSGTEVHVTIGTDFFLTEPEALKALHSLLRHYPAAKAHLMQQGSETFHPKVYCAVRDSMAPILLGSANLTGGGLRSNFELSLLHTTSTSSTLFRTLKTWIDTLQTENRLTPLDPLTIGRYHARCELYRKITRPAERQARSEIKSQRALDDRLLRQYLSEYSADSHQLADWLSRERNYRLAKRLLDIMLKTPPKTRAAFLDRYGLLVGTRGKGSLWHSGNISRLKSQVADKHAQFIVMLRALHKAIGDSPQQLFALAKRHIDRIPGVGPNVVTEILNTYAPSRFPVLNNNPISSLKELGLHSYPRPSQFDPKTYADYTIFMQHLAVLCGFRNLSRLDHFMNYVYWTYVKPKHRQF